MTQKSVEDITNFIYRANRSTYNSLEARESDIISFIEQALLAERAKTKDNMLKGERRRIIEQIREEVREENKKYKENLCSFAIQSIKTRMDTARSIGMSHEALKIFLIESFVIRKDNKENILLDNLK